MVPDTTRSDIIHYPPAELAVRPRQVARYFGGMRYAPDPRTREHIAAAVKQGVGLVRPAAVTALYRVKETAPGGKVVLAGGLTLKDAAGFHESQSVFLAAAVATLGPHLETRCRELSQKGDLFAATLMDAVGIAFLDELGAKVHHGLTRRATDLALFCSCRLGPGLNGFPFEGQRLIFNMVDAAAIGVSLNDSLVMQPVKSISFLTSLGPTPGRLPGAKCRNCTLVNCQFRQAPADHHP